MSKFYYLSLGMALVLIGACQTQKEPPKAQTAFADPPNWAKSVIWYEIAVERFYNGDPSNDPRPEDIVGAYPGFVPEGWQPSDWTKDWYADDPYIANITDEVDFYGNPITNISQKAQLRRYGGDLQGVLKKVDYLSELGVSAIYFRPLNDAPSLHKYDARNWRHIDRNFGPTPQKDAKTMAQETPDDPKTWQWTEADKLFLKVVEELHKRDIRVIMDYSFNHTGSTFWAWQDILKHQADSKYKDWYWIDHFDDPNTPENEFKYHGWAGVHELPEIKETQRQDLSVKVKTFEGNLYHEAVKKHIFALTERWLDPNGDGDPSDGIDGYRLDVAAETPLGFWREFRKHVRGINPDAYLVGEIWWEEWPDHLLDPAPTLQGDVFDAVMNYRWYRAARHFFNASPTEIPASELIDSLQSFSATQREQNNFAMMNLHGSFDTPRVLTSLFNKNKYKYQVKATDNPDYKVHKPDAETYTTLKLLLAHQYTYVGAPYIWAGDEMGMWGADDPSTRKPLTWPEMSFEAEKAHPLGKERPVDEIAFDQELFAYYQKLIEIRKNNPVLSEGKLHFLPVSQSHKILAYARSDEEQEIIFIANIDNQGREIALPTLFEGVYQDLLGGGAWKTSDQQLSLSLSLNGRSTMILRKN